MRGSVFGHPPARCTPSASVFVAADRRLRCAGSTFPRCICSKGGSSSRLGPGMSAATAETGWSRHRPRRRVRPGSARARRPAATARFATKSSSSDRRRSGAEWPPATRTEPCPLTARGRSGSTSSTITTWCDGACAICWPQPATSWSSASRARSRRRRDRSFGPKPMSCCSTSILRTDPASRSADASGRSTRPSKACC